MPTVRDVLAEKGGTLHTIAADATVLDATKKMNQHKIGALVVMQGDRPVGILTERDILTRVIAEELTPRGVLVAQAMTNNMICCEPTDDLDDVSAIMKKHRVRHIPVCCATSGTLHGIISIGDVNAQYASNAEQHIHFLNEYLYGRV